MQLSTNMILFVAVLAAIIGAIVRVLKSDVPITPTIPARYRPALAIALGAVGGILEALAKGSPLASAVAAGVTAGGTAIVGHTLIVDVLRGGREIGAGETPNEETKENT